MVLRDFSGGKNIRLAPNLLAENEAQIYTNIDNSGGVLKGIKGPLSTGIVVDEYFTYFNYENTWVSSTIESDYVEYLDKLYISNGNELQEYKQGVYSNLGITGLSDKCIPTKVSTLTDANIIVYDIPRVVDQADITTSVTDITTGVNASTQLLTLIVANPPKPIPKVLPGLSSGPYSYKLVIHSTILNTDSVIDFNYIIPSTTFNERSIVVELTANSNYAIGDIATLYREINGIYTKVSANVLDSNYQCALLESLLTPEFTNTYTSDVPTYNYVYTYYDSATGVESLPSLPSEDIITNIGNISIDIPVTVTTLESIDTVRLYRIGGSLIDYTLVTELTYPAISSTLTYIDTSKDLDIAGNYILDSLDNDKPISGLKYLTEAYAMLFAAKDDKLYYSKIAKPYAWPSTNFIDFDDTITGIGAVSNGLLVFTKYKTYLIIGNNPNNFSKYLLSSAQGCISHKSIAFIDNQLIWVSTDGICTTSGGVIKVVSLPKLGKLSFTQIYSATVLDNVYYLSYYNVITNKILAFDFRYNTIVRDIEIEGNMVVNKLDNLYQYYNGTLQKLFYGTDLEWHWKSGLLTEGQYSNYKKYKDMYIKYNGTFHILVYIDGTIVNDINITGNSMYNLKFNSSARGYGLEIEITGTGEVSEIVYNVIPREKA